MNRSLARWVAGLVLLGWAAIVILGATFSMSQSWTVEDARADGVFLVYQLLEEHPPELRPQKLEGLRQHFSVGLGVISAEEAERRVGRPVRDGDVVPIRVSRREHWYFQAFSDGGGVLAAGPVDPVIPRGAFPIGMLLAMVAVPLFVGVLALLVDRSQRRVERASEAIADGNLSARVDEGLGPSQEMLTRFNAMAERVEWLVRSRDELVQAVSHELGTPLARLRFQLELLETSPDAEREKRIRRMARELDALDDLVAELLGYIQSDELALERQVFTPRGSLADLAELAQLDDTADVVPEVRLDLEEGLTAYADQRLFQRAVENLLRNAVQHARAKVRLELAQDGAGIRVTVHDDGPGIQPELRDKVVAPFYRVEGGRSRKTGGVGLGLAIVRRILERHGGHLDIGVSPLGGAAVKTWWPRVAEDAG